MVDQPDDPDVDGDGARRGTSGVDPSLVRMLDALRRGSDPGVFRGVVPATDGDGSGGPGDDRVDGDDDGEPVPAAAAVSAVAAPAPRAEPGTRAAGGAGAPTAGAPAAAPRFDLSDLLPRLGVPRLATRVDVSSWGPAFWAHLEDLRHHPPTNWPGPASPAAPDLAAVEAAVGDGVAVVGAPRAEVVSALLTAESRAERLAVLLAHEREVLQDCRAVLSTAGHPSLAGARWLAGRALDALGPREGQADGHPEAALALATSVAHAAATRSLRGRRAQVKQQVLLDPDLARCTDLRLRAAFAPLLAVGRHVDVADTAAWSRGEAVAGVLLAATVVGALADLTRLVEAAEPAAEVPAG